jgi:hypothetical protein
MDAAHREEQLVQLLLGPFERLEPATLAARRSRLRRRVIYVAVAVALIITGGTLAGSLNPLSGIGAADHPSTPSDRLGPAVKAQLRLDRPPPGAVDQIGGRLTGSARFIGTLPNGRRVYVVPTSKGRLCVVVEQFAESCGDPLRQAEPVTFTTVFRHPGEPTYAYGIARDGVAAVSFTVGGEHVTVPVQHNLFVYETAPGDSPRGFGDVKATFTDGSVEPVG